MKRMKLITVSAFSKEDAFLKSGLGNSESAKFDATLAWKKDAPENQEALVAFAKGYAEKKSKSVVGNFYIVALDPGVADSRERPYKTNNVVTDCARKWKTVYQGFINASFPGEGGTLVLTKDTKGDAESAAKEYVTEHKKDVEVRLGKKVTEGQSLALTVVYTPSLNTKEGSYIVFGYEQQED